jgi:hypothetical protein
MKNTDLLKSVSVWRRLSSGSAVVYQGVENLESGLFSVLIATSFRLPVVAASLPELQASFVERLIEFDHDGTLWFKTLAEAIEAHIQQFDDDYFHDEVPTHRTTFGYSESADQE